MHYSGLVPPEGFHARDYIHVDKLLELRRLRATDPSRHTHLMIKSLLQLAAVTRKQEEEQFLAGMGKSKKGKKKKPPQIAPLRLRDEMRAFHRSRHVSRSVFESHMMTDPNLVRAFLPVALRRLIARAPVLVVTRDGDPRTLPAGLALPQAHHPYAVPGK
eukprot:TRINITY_DN46975_c0_g1_i1.p1 TRINITY_DN46975_c0_g1~~TRINITY_DN46975_c0_g1_i1.p1  ORF type:complete len:178 (+),score=55.71 TRINITY_DN46975_c0_g1_i1:56-535(+)